MSFEAFLFEISDKIFSVGQLYIFFIALGLIGLALSFWRWWIGLIWLILPLYAFVSLQISEMNALYVDVVHELGKSYIWHSYFSMIIAVLLNAAGILIQFIKPKKLILK